MDGWTVRQSLQGVVVVLSCSGSLKVLCQAGSPTGQKRPAESGLQGQLVRKKASMTLHATTSFVDRLVLCLKIRDTQAPPPHGLLFFLPMCQSVTPWWRRKFSRRVVRPITCF